MTHARGYGAVNDRIEPLTIISARRIGVIMPTDLSHADELIAAGLRSARSRLARTSRVVLLLRAA